jgi:hypothetical protein
VETYASAAFSTGRAVMVSQWANNHIVFIADRE